MAEEPKKILFLPTSRSVSFKNEESILSVALSGRVKINHSCGGMGTCGTCRIIIEENNSLLQPRNEIEMEIASDRGFEDNERLACQTSPVANLKVRIP